LIVATTALRGEQLGLNLTCQQNRKPLIGSSCLLAPRSPAPKCEAKFSLQEGFARQALEKFEQSTKGRSLAVREAERAAADARALQLAAQRD